MRRATWLIVGGFLISAVSSAQEPLAPEGAIEQLIEEERFRSAVEDALEYAHQPGIAGAQRVEIALEAIGNLIEVGPGVVPYLVNELDRADPATFFFSAFALSHFATEESEIALRRALERANLGGSDFANIRKAWCGYALGFMGVVEALDLVNEGQHAAGRYQIHAGMSVIEAVALLNATSSVPLLLKQLDDYAEIDSLWAMRVFTLRALGLLRDRSTVPRLLTVLQEERTDRYPEALEALGRIGDDRAIPAVISALDNPDQRIRNRAANALDWLRTPAQLEWAVDRLNTETDTYVRRTLYRLIAAVGGTSQLATLQKHWGHPDPIDRQYLVQAVASLECPETIDILRAALNDPNDRVAYRAIVALADLGTPEALTLLHEAVRSRSLSRSRAAVDEVIRIGDRSAAPSIAQRLFEVELSVNVVDPRRRERAELLAEGLVALEYPQALPGLTKALELQHDTPLRQSLQSVIGLLELQQESGNKLKPWVEALDSTELAVRLAAYDKLAEIGGENAAKALAARFGRVDPVEGMELLHALGAIDSPTSVALIKRVLLEPEFDAPEMLRLRDMAAWSARRIGGDEMLGALQAAVERRNGRDAKVMVYLAVLGGPDALPTLARFRLARLRYLNYFAGREMEKLDWITRQLERGESIDEFDVPPARIQFE